MQWQNGMMNSMQSMQQQWQNEMNNSMASMQQQGQKRKSGWDQGPTGNAMQNAALQNAAMLHLQNQNASMQPSVSSGAIVPHGSTAQTTSGLKQQPGLKGQMCTKFLAGKCTWGDQCYFSHSAGGGAQQAAQGGTSSSAVICRNFLMGSCSWGQACAFSHVGKKTGNEPSKPWQPAKSVTTSTPTQAITNSQPPNPPVFGLIVSGFPAYWSAQDLKSFVEDMSPSGCAISNAYSHPSQEGANEMVLCCDTEGSARKVKKALVGVNIEGGALAVRFGPGIADDYDGCTVFVENLNKSSGSERLRDMFSEIGYVVSAHVLYDSATEESRCVAKVRFQTPEKADKAFQKFNGSTLDDSSITVRIFMDGDDNQDDAEFIDDVKDPRRQKPKGKGKGDVSKGPEIVKFYDIFVGSLSTATTKPSLEHHFSAAGKVVASHIFLHRDTKESKGAGKVTFEEERSVAIAVEILNGSTLDGRSIIVKKFGEKDERSQEELEKQRQEREKEKAEKNKEIFAKSIFVGSLSDSTTEDDIYEYFDDLVGDVAKVHLFVDKNTGQSRRSCRVEFLHAETLQEIIDMRDKPMLNGRWIQVQPFHGGDQEGADGQAALGHAEESHKWVVHLDEVPALSRPEYEAHPECKEVFVDGLPPDGEELKAFLADFGEVDNVYRLPDQNVAAKDPTDKGYVCFHKHEDAKKCVEAGFGKWSESERVLTGRHGVQGLPDILGLFIGTRGKTINKMKELSGCKIVRIGGTSSQSKGGWCDSDRMHWIAEGSLKQFAALVAELEVLVASIHENLQKDSDDETSFENPRKRKFDHGTNESKGTWQPGNLPPPPPMPRPPPPPGWNGHYPPPPRGWGPPPGYPPYWNWGPPPGSGQFYDPGPPPQDYGHPGWEDPGPPPQDYDRDDGYAEARKFEEEFFQHAADDEWQPGPAAWAPPVDDRWGSTSSASGHGQRRHDSRSRGRSVRSRSPHVRESIPALHPRGSAGRR